jgi:hypothetical protein
MMHALHPYVSHGIIGMYYIDTAYAFHVSSLNEEHDVHKISSSLKKVCVYMYTLRSTNGVEYTHSIYSYCIHAHAMHTCST